MPTAPAQDGRDDRAHAPTAPARANFERFRSVQTVTPIQPGAGTASAKESPLVGSDDGAFPTTLRQALSPAAGNAPPPAHGNTVPASAGADQPATTAPLQQAGASADAAATLLPHAVKPLDADPLHPAATPAVAANSASPLPAPVQQNGADAAPPPEASAAPAAAAPGAPADTAPQISAALQDIAAARRVADPAGAKPARTAPTTAAPAVRPDTAPRRLAADDESLPQPTTAEGRRPDDAHRDSDVVPAAATATADPVAPPPDGTGTPPALVALPQALVALPQALATPPQAPATSPHAPAAQQPASAATVALPPGRGPVTAGPGVDRPTGQPDETSTGTDDTGPVRVGLPAKDGPPAAPAGEAPVRVVGAPVVTAPAATAPAAAPPQLAQPILPASVAGVGTATPADTARPGHMPDVAIDAPPGSPQFGPQLGERLLWLVRDGIHEARLQLNPRELGPVEVRLSVGDGAAQVSFSAQHAGTAAAVQQSLPQLRDLLAQQGLQLGQASVFHQPAGDGAAGGQQQAQHSGVPWGAAGGGGMDFDDVPPAATARVVGHGLVDAYA
jgi:flagellar hook-length control protein FliK